MDTEIKSADGPPIRVAVIGISYVGALLKAYRSAPPAGLDVTFFGGGRANFNTLRVADGQILNARHVWGTASKAVSAYDAFVLYADLHTPHVLFRTEQKLRQERYSSGVTMAALRDMIGATSTPALRQALCAASPAPVYFLSYNIQTRIRPLESDAEYDRGVALVRSLVDEQFYIEFPRELFDSGYIPHQRYYKGSVNVHGKPVGDDADEHDFAHMNELGGKLMLDHIAERIRHDLKGKAVPTHSL